MSSNQHELNLASEHPAVRNQARATEMFDLAWERLKMAQRMTIGHVTSKERVAVEMNVAIAQAAATLGHALMSSNGLSDIEMALQKSDA